jgi:hypothetical protein
MPSPLRHRHVIGAIHAYGLPPESMPPRLDNIDIDLARMNRILFLCTGNYYRSRFAEILFNWHARQRGLRWTADSRGLALDPTNDEQRADFALHGVLSGVSWNLVRHVPASAAGRRGSRLRQRSPRDRG